MESKCKVYLKDRLEEDVEESDRTEALQSTLSLLRGSGIGLFFSFPALPKVDGPSASLEEDRPPS
jgi:hypothetical protein